MKASNPTAAGWLEHTHTRAGSREWEVERGREGMHGTASIEKEGWEGG